MTQYKQQAERFGVEEMRQVSSGMSMAAVPYQEIAGSGYEESDEHWRFGDVFQDSSDVIAGSSDPGMSSSNDIR